MVSGSPGFELQNIFSIKQPLEQHGWIIFLLSNFELGYLDDQSKIILKKLDTVLLADVL